MVLRKYTLQEYTLSFMLTIEMPSKVPLQDFLFNIFKEIIRIFENIMLLNFDI